MLGSLYPLLKRVFFRSLAVFALGSIVSSAVHATPVGETPQQKGSAPAPKPPSIVFASISGRPPQFIDSGEEKGSGWVEMQTHEIRKGVATAGFEVKLEWMTPARIDNEFRHMNPICTWPSVLKSPKTFFKEKSGRIYSIPLDLDGEETQSILIRKEDAIRFRPFLDDKGDIQFSRLIRDTTLKTLLIRNQDYGELTNELTFTKPNGDQAVKQEFSKHIYLELIRENQQLIEMLNGKRFDYILAEAINDEDFAKAKLNPSSFLRLNYNTGRVSDIEDPRLKLLTISCSAHPLTMAAMPYFNRWIKNTRGINWINKTYRFKKSLEPHWKATHDYSTVEGFRGTFESGGADKWYNLQQRHYPDLQLYPPLANAFRPEPSTERKNSPKPNPRKWFWIPSLDGTSITLASSADFGFRTDRSTRFEITPDRPTDAMYQIFPADLVWNTLNPEEQVFLKDRASLPEGRFKAFNALGEMESIFDQKAAKTRALTLFAYGLKLADLRFLGKTIAEMERITVIGAGPEETEFLVSHLSSKVTSLNLTSCSLIKTNLADRLKGLPLKRLYLSNSQVPSEQMNLILQGLPKTIEELSLGYLRTTFRDPLKTKLHWPNLRLLDLENSALSDHHLKPIFGAAGDKLEVLRVGNNFLSLESLLPLFRRTWPSLKELDLSASSLIHSSPLIFPQGIEKLGLADVRFLTSEIKQNSERIIWPQAIHSLELTRTKLLQQDFLTLPAHLAGPMESLILTATRPPPEVLTQILSNSGLTKISYLNLAENGIGGKELQAIGSSPIAIENLILRANRIKSSDLRWLYPHVPHLKGLDLSENPIQDTGKNNLFPLIGGSLLSLNLNSLLSFDAPGLAARFPKSLRRVSLAGNQLSDPDVKAIFLNAPDEIQELNLESSAFGSSGAQALASRNFSALRTLSLEGTELPEDTAFQLIRALPRSLRKLSFGPISRTPLGPEPLDRPVAFPESIQELRLTGLQLSSGSILQLFRSIPRSISKLKLFNTAITFPDLPNLMPQLREIYFEGSPIDSRFVSSFARTLTPTLERLSFLASNWNDDAIRSLTPDQIQNVAFFQLPQNPITDQGLLELMKKAPCQRGFFINGKNLSGAPLSGLSPRALACLRTIRIPSLALSGEHLIRFLKNLSPDTSDLLINSVLVSAEQAKGMVEALPKKLRRLSVRGIPLGQSAKDDLFHHALKQELVEGIHLEIYSD